MPSVAKKPRTGPQFEPIDDTEALSTCELYQEFLIALVDPENRKHVYVSDNTVGDTINLIAHCHPDDIGKVVGKEGKCLEEMTKVLNRIEGRNHLKVHLDLDPTCRNPVTR